MTAKNVTNHTQSPLGLPNGTIVDPGKTVLVKDWGKIESNTVVKGWLDAKALTLSAANEEKADQTNETNGGQGGTGAGTGNSTGTLFVAKTEEELRALTNGELAAYIESEDLGGNVKSGATKDDLVKQALELQTKKAEASAQ